MRRLVNLAYLLLTLCLSMCSCASDQKLVNDATATRDSHEPRYLALCVKEVGSPTCKECQLAGNELKQEIQNANAALKIGKLPKSARKKIKDARDHVERICP